MLEVIALETHLLCWVIAPNLLLPRNPQTRAARRIHQSGSIDTRSWSWTAGLIGCAVNWQTQVHGDVSRQQERRARQVGGGIPFKVGKKLVEVDGGPGNEAEGHAERKIVCCIQGGLQQTR